jgi:hypothetical protein
VSERKYIDGNNGMETIADDKYTLIINRGNRDGFDIRTLEKKEFLRETSTLLERPKKIFLGLGDFLEFGDYNKLLDSIFFDEEAVQLENILDKINRELSEEGNIPFSFFKLAVYFPDFLLKDVPTTCVSAIGKKSRLFPGAETFVKYIKEYDPLVLTAIPFEIAIEFVKRVGLGEKNLIATQYKVSNNEKNTEVFAGDIHRFISGDRKSIEIEKVMNEKELRDDEVVYIGRGEAGVKTFATVNSVAFNPPENIIPASRITLYGSSLEALLVLFNFEGELEKLLLSEAIEQYLPSLVVYSEVKEKPQELIDIELEHGKMQNNFIGQRIEHSGESYSSVERDIEVAFGGSSIDINAVRRMISERMSIYRKNPQQLVNDISWISRDRYTNFGKI